MDVIEEKDEFALEAEARMKAPLEWDSTAKCKILDLNESQYDEALRLIKRHFFRDEPMCKSSSLLEDQASVSDYLQLIRTWMKDTTSLIATSIKSGRVVGVAVMRINSGPEKTDAYNRVQILEGEVLRKIMHLQNTLLVETKAQEVFRCEEYLCVYILCVHPSYREKGVEYAILNASVQVATTLKMRAIGGIFTCGVNQTAARSVGFKLVSEIRYSLWTINDQIVFDDPGRGNYSAAFMGQMIQLQEDANHNRVSSVGSVSVRTG